MKRTLGLLFLLSLLMTSCKDELSDSIDAEMKKNEKIEKEQNSVKPTSNTDKRRDKDWDILVGS